MRNDFSTKLIRSRYEMAANNPLLGRTSDAAEGGCGVLGFASSVPVAGRHVLSASRQMHNRGNGKGGGIAMAGLDAAQMRVDVDTLRSHTLLQIAVLDASARKEVERDYITPFFDVAQAYEIEHLDDYRTVDELEVRPPDVWRYFVRVKPDVLARFAEQHDFDLGSDARAVEDEFVFQNSFHLNESFYASLGEKRAFVLCHGRDLVVLKIVGYAEQVTEYYCLEDQTAHIWIAHQRYPTKGRVWHPGGAHPFVGLNEALVHNGDFANYHAVSEYLRQRNITQQFLTDTEVGVQLFDLWDRVYRYPLEVTLEAMAPTTEFDYEMLPQDKKDLYRLIQSSHIHGSPDGPWFFIVARSKPDEGVAELIGITDTSMLRPQVFALYENDNDGLHGGKVQIGLIASERQAINACMRSLSAEDNRFQPFADKYWVARGGSHTDGGAFSFRVTRDGTGTLTCENKFGSRVEVESGRRHVDSAKVDGEKASADFKREMQLRGFHAFDDGGAPTMFEWARQALAKSNWNEAAHMTGWLRGFAAAGDAERAFALDSLTLLRDRRFDLGDKKRASLLMLIDKALHGILRDVPELDQDAESSTSARSARRVDWKTRTTLRAPRDAESTLVVDVVGFLPEGEESAARFVQQAAKLGWQKFVTFGWHGGRFAACGLGPATEGLSLELYGDAGDYAASGLDGAEVQIHADAQDQVGQILKSGKLVIHGDVGQTFLYGAKGGDVYVLGSAAGRPLINAVGRPRVVINGTCLDYLAESFMAGDALNGGGFIIMNGLAFDEGGHLVELESPYPGGNLMSLASGGAIYIRDPHGCVQAEQLNGGELVELSDADWKLIEPYLLENERQFGISLDDLLTVDGVSREPREVYRKVQVSQMNTVLQETENR